jgi:hypothetical protein
MKTYLIRLEERERDVALRIFADGRAVNVLGRGEVASCRGPVHAAEVALRTIADEQNFNQDSIEDECRSAGVVLSLEGSRVPRDIASAHLYGFPGVSLEALARGGRPINELAVVLERVVEQWVTLVSDDENESPIARRWAARRTTPESRTVALRPKGVDVHELGSLLEFVSGRALPARRWADELHCDVRVVAGSGEPHTVELDDSERAEAVKHLEQAGAALLDTATNERRKRLLEHLRDGRRALSTTHFLTEPGVSASAWEVRFFDADGWFEGLELVAMFTATSDLPHRADRASRVGAQAARTLVVEREGDALHLSGHGRLASFPLETLSRVATALAYVEGGNGGIDAHAVEQQLRNGELDKDHPVGNFAVRFERLMTATREGTVSRRHVRDYLGHVYGRTALLRPLLAEAPFVDSGHRQCARSVVLEIRETARRLARQAENDARNDANAQRSVAASALRSLISERVQVELQTAADTLQRLSETLSSPGVKAQRMRALRKIIVTPTDLRSGTDRRNIVRLAERLLGRPMRAVMQSELDAAMKRLSSAVEAAVEAMAGAEGRAHVVRFDVPRPHSPDGVDRHLDVSGDPNDGVLVARLDGARETYSTLLEVWLEEAVSAAREAALEYLMSASEYLRAAALASIPSERPSGACSEGDAKRRRDLSQQLLRLAADLEEALT